MLHGMVVQRCFRFLDLYGRFFRVAFQPLVLRFGESSDVLLENTVCTIMVGNCECVSAHQFCLFLANRYGDRRIHRFLETIPERRGKPLVITGVRIDRYSETGPDDRCSTGDLTACAQTRVRRC